MEKILYITDLDGTLLGSDEKISDRTADIISSLILNGTNITYATARAYSSAQKVTGKINFNIPVATYNGAIIVDPASNSIIETCFIDKSIVANIVNSLCDALVYPIVYSLHDGKETLSWMRLQGTDGDCILRYISSRNSEITIQKAQSIEQLLSGDIYYLVSIGSRENAKYIKRLFNRIDGLSYNLQEDNYQNGLFWFEASSKEATKERSLHKLKRLVQADKVICFGDNINDISMFQSADYSIAVGNAHPKLKKYANAITLPNSQDGVAEWFLNNIK
jgi:5-amino-6-(5-phospho-D-ribitylamino)uracil phosphatase